MSWKAPLRKGMCCKQPLHAFAWEFSEEGRHQIHQRELFALKCWCYANTAQRFSPSGAMPNTGLCRIRSDRVDREPAEQGVDRGRACGGCGRCGRGEESA